jgi:hypothetical protein
MKPSAFKIGQPRQVLNVENFSNMTISGPCLILQIPLPLLSLFLLPPGLPALRVAVSYGPPQVSRIATSTLLVTSTKTTDLSKTQLERIVPSSRFVDWEDLCSSGVLLLHRSPLALTSNKEPGVHAPPATS